MTVTRHLIIVLLLLPSLAQCRRVSTTHPSAPAKPPIAKAGSSDALSTTVCAIAAEPEEFYGKRVRVDGCVTTDGIEHTVLRDKNCPYVGIGPAESGKLRPDQRFFAEVDKQVCGTFMGVFEASRSLGTMIVIEETANLKTGSRM
jgi:hypothetical protein